MGAYTNSPTLSNGTISDLLGLPFPKIGGSQPHPKLQSLLPQERVKQDLKFGRYRIHPNKSPLKISKKKRERIEGLPNFWLPSIISRTGKAANFKFCTQIRRIDRNKMPIKNFGKSNCGRSQGPQNFSGIIFQGASHGHLCDSSAFLCVIRLRYSDCFLSSIA